MSKLPTAEESLNKSGVFIEDFISSSTYSACISAIESHTTTHTAELRERVKELESQLTKYREALERVLQSLQSRRPYTPGLGAPINIIRSVLKQEDEK